MLVSQSLVLEQPPPRRLAVKALLAVSAAAARLAARLQQAHESPAVSEVALREVGQVRIGGEMVCAVYEDGRLVALLRGVERL